MKIIDLFCGCGGLSLGFKNAGFEIIASYDNWKPAIETYKRNFTHPVYEMDLSNSDNYDKINMTQASIVIGGPPCQDFSSAGKRDESLGRADLTIHFSNIVSWHKPEWFVMENVEQILKSKALKQAVINLRREGYGLTQIVLNASFCGVPQNRKRLFIIGQLNGHDDFLLPELINRQSNKSMSIYDYLGDSLNTEFYYRHPRSYQRRAIFSIYEPSPTIRGVNRPIPPTYKFHEGDVTKDLAKVRVLSLEERAYIQTFSSNFEFVGSKTEKEQLIGNAVPVKLAEFVAKILFEYVVKKNNY